MATPDAVSLFNAAGASGVLLDSIFKTAAVGNILTMVNVVILAAGTAWLTWNILAGIAQSAWDGEILGKRFHTMWLPIRNALGFAMLIPAFSGWGAAQLILYQSAKMGAGAANIAISSGAGAFTAPKASDFTAPVASDYFPQARQIFEMHDCRERAKIHAAQMADPATELGGTAAQWERFMDIAGCGRIDHIPLAALSDAHMAATRTLDVTLQTLAASVAAGAENLGPVIPEAQITQQLRLAAQAYKATIEAAAKASIESKIGQINNGAAGADWLAFGFKAVAAGQVAREVNSATSKTAILKGNRVDGEPAAQLHTNPGEASTDGEFQTGARTDGESRSVGVKEFLGALKSAPETLLRWFFGGVNVKTLVGGGGDLIAALQGIGTSLLNLAGAAVAALLALGAAAIWLGPAAISLASISLSVTAIVFAVVVPLVITGATLAAWLPMVPAVFWSLAVLGWLLTVAEALFMAPLWAFIHLETEGEGMGQKTEKGYAFIMNLMLRPLVLVFTFTIASMLLNVVWAMLGSHIADAMKSVDLISFSGVFLFLGYAFVLVTTATMMIYKVYGTAIGLADAIPAWLGTNFHNYTSGLSAGDGFGKGESMRPGRPGGGLNPGKPGGGVDRPVVGGASGAGEDPKPRSEV